MYNFMLQCEVAVWTSIFSFYLSCSGGAAASVLTPSAPLSMEEYAERIPHSKRNVAISTDVEIAQIAQKIRDWGLIAPYLKISDPQVQEIKNNHYNYEDQKLAVRSL